MTILFYLAPRLGVEPRFGGYPWNFPNCTDSLIVPTATRPAFERSRNI